MLGTHDIYQHHGYIFQLHLDGIQPLLSLQPWYLYVRRVQSSRSAGPKQSAYIMNSTQRLVWFLFVFFVEHFREVILSIK